MNVFKYSNFCLTSSLPCVSPYQLSLYGLKECLHSRDSLKECFHRRGVSNRDTTTFACQFTIQTQGNHKKEIE